MENKAVLSAFFGYLIFGFSFMFAKIALDVASPFILLMYRFIFAFLILSVLLLSGKFKVNYKGKRIGPLLLLGIFQPVLYFFGENYGIAYSNSTFAAIMIALVPISSTIFASVFLKENPTKKQWVFCVLSIAGVIVMALQNSANGTIKPIGVALLMLAVFADTGYMYIRRKYSKDFTAFESTYSMMICGAIVFSSLAVIENIDSPGALIAPLYDISFLTSVLYLSVLSSVAAFLLLNFAAAHIPVARTVVFSNLCAVVSVFAGVVFLNERCTAVSFIASIVTIVGIYGVQKYARHDTD